MKYKISRKRKLVFEWIVNVLHAYNILFALAFVESTECSLLTAYYCVCVSGQTWYLSRLGDGVE